MARRQLLSRSGHLAVSGRWGAPRVQVLQKIYLPLFCMSIQYAQGGAVSVPRPNAVKTLSAAALASFRSQGKNGRSLKPDKSCHSPAKSIRFRISRFLLWRRIARLALYRKVLRPVHALAKRPRSLLAPGSSRRYIVFDAPTVFRGLVGRAVLTCSEHADSDGIYQLFAGFKYQLKTRGRHYFPAALWMKPREDV